MTVRDVDLDQRQEHIVVGPPGTGKTTWLARQANRAADRFGGEHVAVISLTRAAAAEVAGRKTKIPEKNIGTLHAHAYRALKQPPLAETPEGVKEWNEVCGTPSWKLTSANPDADVDLVRFGDDGDKLLGQANLNRARELDVRLWAPNVAAFYEAWTAWKAESGRLDFTDLIDEATDTIPEMPGRPLVVMVDEAQDMSAPEIRLIMQWARSAMQFIVVGDPDQALYTWRGASPKAVFGTDREKVRVLSQSYRVPAAVHAEAVKMIQRVEDRLDVEYRPRVDEAGEVVPGEVTTANLQVNDPEPLAAAAIEASQSGTVMVLTSCGYMLTPLCHRLKELGVPFHNPYRLTSRAWNPLLGVNRLMAFLRPHGGLWGKSARLWTWSEMKLWTEPMQAKGVLIRGAKARIAREAEVPQEHAIPLADILELFHPAHHEALVDLDTHWWRDNLKAPEMKRLSFGVQLIDNHGIEALHAEPKIIVGTIHSVKGGEADTVLVFPDLSQAGYYDGWQKQGEKRDSIIRLFYVGFTRARERLVLGRSSGMEAIPWT